jgi:octaprenyl-diphosphate synthase
LHLVGVEQEVVPAAGGKMLRPALCLMAAGAIGGRDLTQYVQLAGAFEALHIASLAHDDVIDKALLRRGVTALHAMWDNHAAILGGDYLVARSVEMLAQYDSCPVIANAITSVRRMAEGELLYFGRDYDAMRPEDCILLAQQKTASLFAEACSAPTYIIDPTHRDHLHAFGTGLGTAFQIIDDLLDVTQPTEHLGKPSCGDVVEGKKTLPIIFLRSALPAGDQARFDSFRETGVTEEDRGWIGDRVEATGARDQTLEEAGRHTAQALDALHQLPPSEYREAMEGVADLLLVRSA